MLSFVLLKAALALSLMRVNSVLYTNISIIILELQKYNSTVAMFTLS